MDVVNLVPTPLILLLVSLYSIFLALLVIIAIIQFGILQVRQVKNRKRNWENHIYKIVIRGTTWQSLRSTSDVWISLHSEKGTSDFFVLPHKSNVISIIYEESYLSFSIQTKQCLEELNYLILVVRDKGFFLWQVDSITVDDVEHEKSFDFNFYSSLEVNFKPRIYIASCPKPFLPTLVFKCINTFLKYHNWISAFARFNAVLEVSNSLHLTLVFVVYLQGLLLGLFKVVYTPVTSESILNLRLDTFIIFYLFIITLIPDIVIHASKCRTRYSKQVWGYKVLEKFRRPGPQVKPISPWLESLERLNTEQDEMDGTLDKAPYSPEDDDLSREINLTDVLSVDSLEIETLTQQRYSAISSIMTPADILQPVDDPDMLDTMSWMSFYDEESPFFTVSTLDKYTQFTTLYQPFKPRQLIRNRLSLWIHFLQKWHKVQLRSVRTYRLLYAFWWTWQQLDVDIGLLQREMNKMQTIALEFQNTGQKIRDSSIWLESHPLWRVGIELPRDALLIAPYEQLIELIEQTVVHVTSNFLDHYNYMRRYRKISQDTEWIIEDWFRELVDAFLTLGYFHKSDSLTDDDDEELGNFWQPPPLPDRAYRSISSEMRSNHLIRVIPVNKKLEFGHHQDTMKRRISHIDFQAAKMWYAWLPSLIRETSCQIMDEVQKRTKGLNLVDAITYIQMQKENCVWEEACAKIMGITADVVLRDIIKYICVFLTDGTKRVVLQRTRATLVDCLEESAKPWASLVASEYDLVESQHYFMLVSILKGCVGRCRVAPAPTKDLSIANDDPLAQASKVRLLFLLPDELKVSDLTTERLIPRLNEIALVVNERVSNLKSCVRCMREQFDSRLSKQAEAKERVGKMSFAGVINTLLVLCRLEMMISHVELCRDAIELDIPISSMAGNYNHIDFRHVFRQLASQYGQSRLGKRSLRHSSVQRGLTRVHNPGTMKLERKVKDVDKDVIHLTIHPTIPPLHYFWGWLARVIIALQIAGIPFVVLALGSMLPASSFASVCIIMVISAMMDFAFAQPLKCFLIVLWQRYWDTKGVYYVYQKYPFSCK